MLRTSEMSLFLPDQTGKSPETSSLVTPTTAIYSFRLLRTQDPVPKPALDSKAYARIRADLGLSNSVFGLFSDGVCRIFSKTQLRGPDWPKISIGEASTLGVGSLIWLFAWPCDLSKSRARTSACQERATGTASSRKPRFRPTMHTFLRS